ncbi:WD repeat and HMG-box DNA-binding protein 1-like isoform X2 [Varroa destructor]|uniref:WD repeat and HMG-box DNA-binding protein 1 n=1 Tax=Varroa destructor TaxID=109461 RepID=A0A7M7J6X1_VARDE|nr:WD repeat and HMG-box DNA-binding protein 1-like isoform X2 [Varroa destructor]
MPVSEARYAHCDGFTEGVRFKENYVVTCGADGEMRIWDAQTILEEGPLSITFGSHCNSVVVQDDDLLCAIDGFRVKKVSPLGTAGELLSEAELEPRTFRNFQAEVLHLAASGFMVLACLANGTAVLCKESERSSDIILEGHKAAVLSGALTQEKPLAATASCDGSVRLWSTNDGRCVKKLEDLFTSQDGVDCLQEITRYHRLAFLNDGNLLLIAGERTIKVYEMTTFTVEKEVDIDEIIDDEEVIYAMTTDGFRVGVSTNQGLVNVYSLPEMAHIWSHKFDDTVTSIILPPSNQAASAPLILLSEKGELTCATGIGFQSALGNGAASSSAEGNMKEDTFDPNEEILAGSGIDRSGGDGASRKRKAAEMDGVLDNESIARNDTNEDVDDDGIDLGAIKSSYMPTILGEDVADTEENGSHQRVVVRETVKTIHVKAFCQKPFQVGEAHEMAGHGDCDEDDNFEENTTQERRFLTYNHVGFVVCSLSTEESSIDVDFHNSADRHPLTLPNKGYTMAALDGHALVLASENEMMVYLLEPHAGETNSWEVEVKHDSIVGVTLGPTFVAMATQNQLLRLFTPGGMQREVLGLPGPLLCMVGASMFSLRAQELRPQDNLMVFYHNGTGLDDRQNVACMRLKISYNGVTARGAHIPVGLPRKVRMVWAGYSEEFRPSYMNSKGILFVYSDKMCGWYPVFDSKEKLGHTSSCFMVSIGERYNRVLYVLCKKWSPRVRPLPVIVKEKLQAPLLDVANDKVQLEARYLRLRQLPSQEVETGKAKLTLQMFALALKSDRLTRAADIIRMESSHKETLQLFMEYTDASNRNNRYDGLQKLIREFLGEAESEDEEDAAEDPADEEETLMMDSAEVIRTLPEEPVAPILAPKRVVLGPLGASDKINSGKADFNPFKKSETSAPKAMRTGNLDEILSKKIPKPALALSTKEVPRLAPKQIKLPSTSLTTKSGVSFGTADKRSPLELYMDDVIEELKRECRDGDNDTWLKMAAQRYRALTSDQRAAYIELSRNPSKRARVDIS